MFLDDLMLRIEGDARPTVRELLAVLDATREQAVKRPDASPADLLVFARAELAKLLPPPLEEPPSEGAAR